MELTTERIHHKFKSIYTITVFDSDLKQIKFDNFDRLLFDECDKSNKISDKLLALEKVARLLEYKEEGILIKGRGTGKDDLIDEDEKDLTLGGNEDIMVHSTIQGVAEKLKETKNK